MALLNTNSAKQLLEEQNQLLHVLFLKHYWHSKIKLK